jgi:hypothetical protein
MEVCLGWVADGPFAHPVVNGQDRGLAALLIDERGFFDDGLLNHGCRARAQLATLGRDTGALGASWCRTTCQPETVHFSNDCVTGDPTELAGNLAGA